MEEVVTIIKELFQDIASALNISTEILLYIFLGVLVVLLILLMVFNKKPSGEKKPKKAKEKGPKKDSDFWEVGPEPVIVYERDKLAEKPEPEPELDLKLDLTPPEPQDQSQPKFEYTPEPEVQPEPKFEFKPEPDFQPKPEFKLQSDLPPEPEPLPVSDISPFQRYMSAEPGQEEAATVFKPALTKEPLPHLESDFASEVLLLFSKQGFAIEKVVYHGTYGADFIVAAKGVRTYVQVKDWKKKATPRTVQEARYYANTHNCHNSILIPLAGYTGAANREAGLRAVMLWNAKTIKKLRTGEQTLEELITASSF
ncbi:MAG: restriction endonuclease [Bacillota bacterium]|jgi:hypothetical protein|nr:hypothetical protein [Bacillota bacterium]